MSFTTRTEPTRNLRVLIATPFGSRGRGGMDSLTNLIVQYVKLSPGLAVRARALTTYGPEIKAVMPIVFVASLFRVARARLLGEVNVIHINVAWGASAYRKAILARTAHAMGIPYVIHIHGSRFDQTWPSPRAALCRVIDTMLLQSAAIVVLGKFWSNHVAKNLPPVASKIKILPNATPAIARRLQNDRSEGRLRITFLGALGGRKGSLQLIEALARLRGLPWEATIAGNGDLVQHKGYAAKLGIAERLDFPGWLDPAGVDELLRRTDIFVLPSFAENLPMAILEAFAHGIPVISTPVGAIPEVVEPGVTGLLTAPGDVDALSNALRQLVENPKLRLIMGDAARRAHAARFDILPYVGSLASIWRDAANTAPRPYPVGVNFPKWTLFNR